MGFLISKNKHFLTRLPFWALFLLFIALSPVIIGLVGAQLDELITGDPCGNAGDCGWLVLIYLLPFSVTLACILGGILLLVLLYDVYLMSKKTN